MQKMGLACVCLKNLAVGLAGFKVLLFYAVFCFIIWNLYVRIVDVQIIVKGKNLSWKTPAILIAMIVTSIYLY